MLSDASKQPISTPYTFPSMDLTAQNIPVSIRHVLNFLNQLEIALENPSRDNDDDDDDDEEEEGGWGVRVAGLFSEIRVTGLTEERLQQLICFVRCSIK